MTQPTAHIPTMIPASTGFGGGAQVHIDAYGHFVIDVRGTLSESAATTDISCPRCHGPLAVDDVDTTLLAAQLRCPPCDYAFLQRLRDQSRPSRRAKQHRFTAGA